MHVPPDRLDLVGGADDIHAADPLALEIEEEPGLWSIPLMVRLLCHP